MQTLWCTALVVLVLPVSSLAAEKPSYRLEVALGANFTASSGVEFYVETTLSQGIWNVSIHAGHQRNHLQLQLSETLNLAEDRLGLVQNWPEEPVLQIQASRQRSDFQLDLQGSFTSTSGWSWTLKSLWKPPGLSLELAGQARVLEGRAESWSQTIHWEVEGLSLDGHLDQTGWQPLQFSAEHSIGETTVGLSGQADFPEKPELLDLELRLTRSLGEFDADLALQLTPTSWEGLRLGGARRFGVGTDHMGGTLSFGPEGWQELSVDGRYMPAGTGSLWQGQLGLGPEGLSNLSLIGNLTRSGVQMKGSVTGSSHLWILDLSGSAKLSLLQLNGRFSWMSLSGLQQVGVRAAHSFQF